MPLPILFSSSTKGSRLLGWAYRRLGRRYPAVFVTLELQTAFVVTVATLALYSFYYEADPGDFLKLIAVVTGLTVLGVGLALKRTYKRLRPVGDWIAGDRSEDQSLIAWRTAIGLPLQIVREDMWIPVALVGAPASAASVILLDLHWSAVLPIFAGSLIAISYSGVLHYFAIETGMRPVVLDVGAHLPGRLQAEAASFPLRFPLQVKLLATLPLINVITGVVVAAFTSRGGGTAGLGLDVLTALTVAFTISFELTLLLSRSLLRPIRDLQAATEAISEGDFSHHVPITTSDELGDLGVAFNQMVDGLAERERIREAFGTYLDEEVAAHILSEGYGPEGDEVEVSILFADVRDFTGFASKADATEVVARLNELFESVVPVIARHGGHIDKFEGDGLLAVFGAPQPHIDHADRAVRAAVEMVETVNERGEAGPLRIGVGVNTGRVVAGSIGGAGRLNFSVIGDPVNVAARIEAATRQTGDGVLISVHTREALVGDFELLPRGLVELKGKAEPLELFAAVGAPSGSGLDAKAPLAGERLEA